MSNLSLAGRVVRSTDLAPLPGVAVRLVGPAAALAGVPGAQPLAGGQQITWTRQLTGFAGTRWDCWVKYLRGQVPGLTWEQFWASLPVGLLVADILHANNLRDIDNDRARNKVTIATLLDRPAADYIYLVLTYGAFVAAGAAVALGGMPPEALLCLLALPWAWSATQVLRETEATALNALVRGTASLHMRFGLLLARK